MALRKYRLKVPAELAGARLDNVLVELLPKVMGEPLSKGKVRKLILAGAIYVNRKRVRIASKAVFKDAQIEAAVDMAKLEGPARPQVKAFVLTPESIRYEDEHLIVVSKPEGLPTQPTIDEARANLYASVQIYLGGGKVKAYAGLHHRLDSDTSGLVLFTKTKEANPGVARLFAEHGIRKIYWALARKPAGGAVQNEWVVKNFLGKLPGSKKPSKFGAVRSGGDPAETEFRLVEDLGSYVLVQAFPRTGRTHQIRVHLSEMGMPIVGDRLYGGAAGANLSPPAREGARLGLPAREGARLGLPAREGARLGLPAREGARLGLPAREGARLGLPAREGARLGLPAREGARLMLHARELEFAHPVTGKPVRVVDEPPASFMAALLHKQ